MSNISKAAAVALLLAISSPAMGQTLFEQYSSALSTFSSGFADTPDYATNHFDVISADIYGDWFAIGMMMPKENDLRPFQAACTRIPIKIERTGRFTLRVVSSSGDHQRTVLYTHRSGSAFGAYSDPEETIRALGLQDSRPDHLSNILALQNGIDFIYRPSPDLLVIVSAATGTPTYYGRCP